MTTHVSALALAIATVLTLGAGTALAAPDDAGRCTSDDVMHTSASVHPMHDQMPADLQGDCNALHAQMRSGMGSHMGQMHGNSSNR